MSLSKSKLVIVLVLLAISLAAVSTVRAGEPNQQPVKRILGFIVRAQSPAADKEAEESVVVENAYVAQEASQVFAADTNCCANEGGCNYANDCCCEEKKGKWARFYDKVWEKQRQDRMKVFLHTQKYGKQLLHKVCPPFCTVNFGFHQTCWRRFPEICDPCPPPVAPNPPPAPQAESASIKSGASSPDPGYVKTLPTALGLKPAFRAESSESQLELDVIVTGVSANERY